MTVHRFANAGAPAGPAGASRAPAAASWLKPGRRRQPSRAGDARTRARRAALLERAGRARSVVDRPGHARANADRVSGGQHRPGRRRKRGVLVQADGKLARYWRESSPSSAWHGPDWIAGDVAGNPSAIQSRRAARLSSPAALRECGPCTETPAPWSAGGVFAEDQGQVDAVALAEGPDGELIAVLRAGPLLTCYRLSPVRRGWDGPEPCFRGAAGIPGVACNTYGQAGGFDLAHPRTRRRPGPPLA